MTILIVAISRFCEIIVYMILIRAIMSWFVRNPYGSIYKLYMILCQVTDLIIEPCRRLLQRFRIGTGPLDFAPMVAIIFVFLIQNILLKLLLFF
ncbi:MAG: YggT family protein [Anaerovorax sp.]